MVSMPPPCKAVLEFWHQDLPPVLTVDRVVTVSTGVKRGLRGHVAGGTGGRNDVRGIVGTDTSSSGPIAFGQVGSQNQCPIYDQPSAR
jgi:hypothetical protein